MFLAQIIVAILLASIMLILTERQNSGPLMAQILFMFTLLQLPIGISLPMFTARYGGKGASLSAVILMAVLLSSPSWFASFAFLTGSPTIYLMLILMFVMLYYSVGFMLCNRYANLALIEPEMP